MKATINNAIKLVETTYNENKDNKEILKPISYALYYAWELMRQVEKSREDEFRKLRMVEPTDIAIVLKKENTDGEVTE